MTSPPRRQHDRHECTPVFRRASSVPNWRPVWDRIHLPNCRNESTVAIARRRPPDYENAVLRYPSTLARSSWRPPDPSILPGKLPSRGWVRIREIRGAPTTTAVTTSLVAPWMANRRIDYALPAPG